MEVGHETIVPCCETSSGDTTQMSIHPGQGAKDRPKEDSMQITNQSIYEGYSQALGG